MRRDFEPLQLTLFEPVFERQFDNELERNFAYYLDEQSALHWWHRVAARQQGEYYLQGWKPQRIYPDFVAFASAGNDERRVLICDTKGEHLAGNADTEYKRKVLETLEGAFNSAGSMRLREGTSVKGIFELVFEKDAQNDFAELTAKLSTDI